MNDLQRLDEAGVSIWLDTLSRELLESGAFEEHVRDYGVTGATSNPTIFAKAITGAENRYDEQLAAAARRGLRDPQAPFFELGLEDIRRAATARVPILTECPNWFVGTVLERLPLGDHVGSVLDPQEVQLEVPQAEFTFHRARRIEPGHDA